MRVTSAALYARISDDKEGAGLGTARQLADCRELAEKRGWTVAREYEDNDYSAFSGRKRPGYRQMLADVASGTVNAVVAWHTDRLHRSPLELEEFIALIEQHHVQVEVVNGGMLDLSTPGGRMVARQLGAVARYESEHRSERVRRKHKELAEKGKWSGGGHRPYGYKADGVTLIPAEAAIVREAADRVLAGESLRAISMDFNRRELVGAEGGRWITLRLKTMLRRARISGQREHQGVLYPAEWKAIITPAQLTLLRAKLVPSQLNKGKTLLAGILVCGRCGRRMVSKPRSKQIPCYGCRHETGGCGVNVRAAPLEGVVLGQVKERLRDPAVQALLNPPLHDDDDPEILEIEAARAALVDAGAMYAAGNVSAEAWQAVVAPLEHRISGAQKRIHDRAPGVLRGKDLASLTTWLRSEMAQDLGEFGPWVTSTFDQRRGVLRVLIDKVVVNPTRPGQTFRPERVEVHWR